ncbi:unnamed protein product, partial [Lymnaea stagnalis]
TAATQRFEADKFLDMLSRSFDPQVAYVDLLAALHKRLRLDPANNTTAASSPVDPGASNPNTMVETAGNCPNAPAKLGASITYTSENKILGSRAFYQCDAGYNGRSLFVQCMNGGVWSTPSGWEGCKPVDCGSSPPTIVNADISYTTTTFGSMATYTCQPGYKLDNPSANVTCLDTGYWDTATFSCDKVTLPQLHLTSLKKTFKKNIGVQQIHQLQQLASTLLGATRKSNSNRPPQTPKPIRALKTISSLRRLQSLNKPSRPPQWSPKTVNSIASQKPPQPFRVPPPIISNRIPTPIGPYSPQAMQAMAAAILGNPLMAALLKNMQGMPGFPNFPPTSPTPPPTTTPKPTVASRIQIGGFQLPSHLQSLLPNGLSSTQGMRPQDLMTLASVGLGAPNSAAAPRDISQLLSSMHPMSIFGHSMGIGGPPAGTTGAAGGPGAALPPDPEKMAEQREEMMMRAMMANAMKSMMQPRTATNGTAPAQTSN